MVFALFSVGMVAVFCGLGGDDTSRVSVAGRVRIDGTPLESGSIRFISSLEADQPHVDEALIQNGEYAISGSDSLVPGTYMIQIISDAHEEAPTNPQSHVLARYNEQSLLRVKIHSSGLNRFDLDLKD
jgi:hypothetical protein